MRDLALTTVRNPKTVNKRVYDEVADAGRKSSVHSPSNPRLTYVLWPAEANCRDRRRGDGGGGSSTFPDLSSVTTATSTSTTPMPASPSPISNRRRPSTSAATPTKRNCQTIRASLDTLDLSSTQTLTIRQLVLSHLEELEASLSRFQSPIDIDSLKSSTEDAVEDVRAWANDALDMLERIRSDVCSHLPDLDLGFSLESLVSHLPDVNDVRSHLPDINISDQVREKIELLRSHLPDLPFQPPLDYIPTLTEHLDLLHTHLSSPQINFTVPSVTPLFVLNEMLDKIVTSELYLNLKSSEKAVEDMFEKATHEVKTAVHRSLNGSKLIKYVDLPNEWRNNPFVHRGYLFIPIDKWPLIILSLFALHNETRKHISDFLP